MSLSEVARLKNNMKIKIKNILYTMAAFVLFLPYYSSAADEGLVPCTGADCHISDLGELVNRIITFLIAISFPLAAVMFAIGGFMLMFSGGNQGKIDTAKSLMKSSVLGLLLILFAYLIIKTLLGVLGLGGEYSWL